MNDTMLDPPPTAGAGAVDAALAAAVDLARAAAAEEAGPQGRVGDHLWVRPDTSLLGGKIAVHAFDCMDPAYVGWYWAVEVTRVPRSKVVTVDDVVLLPGPGAVLSPAWVPWAQRLRKGDVGAGDVLPTAADDPRLVLRQADTEAFADDALWLELGLGRARVLSAHGRDDAAERWYDGDPGPDSPLAQAAPAHCGSCGFFVGLVGALGTVFGVCANELAGDDARVVARTHGCGAHSEAMVAAPTEPQPGPAGAGASGAGAAAPAPVAEATSEAEVAPAPEPDPAPDAEVAPAPQPDLAPEVEAGLAPEPDPAPDAEPDAEPEAGVAPAPAPDLVAEADVEAGLALAPELTP